MYAGMDGSMQEYMCLTSVYIHVCMQSTYSHTHDIFTHTRHIHIFTYSHTQVVMCWMRQSAVCMMHCVCW